MPPPKPPKSELLAELDKQANTSPTKQALTTRGMSGSNPTNSFTLGASSRLFRQKIRIGEIITSSLTLIHRYLEDEEQPLDKRAELAARFALKAMPEAHINVEAKAELSPDERKEMLANMKEALMATPTMLEDLSKVIDSKGRIDDEPDAD